MSPGSARPVLRKMLPEEVGIVHELTKQESWDLGLDDVSIVLEISPDRSIVAELDGRIVGGVTVAVAGLRAVLGQVIVDSEHRGRGIGRSMLTSALNQLDGSGVRKVELIGMKGTERMYEGFGFRAVEGILMHSGEPRTVSAEAPNGFEIRPVEREEHDSLELLLARTIGADRWPFARAFIERGPQLALGLFDDGALRGYVQGRSGDGGADVGPWVLERPSKEVAHPMLHSLLRRTGPLKTYSFIPGSCDISAELLMESGIANPVEMTRFIRAPGEGTGPFPDSVLAVCSVEFV